MPGLRSLNVILKWCLKQTCQKSDLDFPAAAQNIPCLTGVESQATKHLIVINMQIDANANEIQIHWDTTQQSIDVLTPP